MNPMHKMQNKRRGNILSVLLALVLMGVISSPAQENNDFYDNTAARDLSGPRRIEVAGEISNPGPVDLAGLPLRSLIVRETHVVEGKSRFLGSYRYDGC